MSVYVQGICEISNSNIEFFSYCRAHVHVAVAFPHVAVTLSRQFVAAMGAGRYQLLIQFAINSNINFLIQAAFQRKVLQLSQQISFTTTAFSTTTAIRTRWTLLRSQPKLFNVSIYHTQFMLVANLCINIFTFIFSCFMSSHDNQNLFIFFCFCKVFSFTKWINFLARRQ